MAVQISLSFFRTDCFPLLFSHLSAILPLLMSIWIYIYQEVDEKRVFFTSICVMSYFSAFFYIFLCMQWFRGVVVELLST